VQTRPFQQAQDFGPRSGEAHFCSCRDGGLMNSQQSRKTGTVGKRNSGQVDYQTGKARRKLARNLIPESRHCCHVQLTARANDNCLTSRSDIYREVVRPRSVHRLRYDRNRQPHRFGSTDSGFLTARLLLTDTLQQRVPGGARD
jgi:hypothetical protein